MRFARSDKVNIFKKLRLHLPGKHCHKSCELGGCFQNISGDEKPKHNFCALICGWDWIFSRSVESVFYCCFFLGGGGGEGGEVVIIRNLKFTFSFHKQKINLWGIAIIRKNKENIIERQNFNGEKFELWEFHNFHLKLLKKIRLLYTRTTTNISLNFTIRTSWTWHGLKTIHLPFLRESLRCTVCSSPNLTYLI